MAEDKEQLIYTIEARIGELEKGMKKATGTANAAYREMKKSSRSATNQMASDAERSARRVNQAMASTTSRIGLLSRSYANMGSNLSTSLKGAFLGLAGAFTIKNAVQLADQYKSIQNALKATGLEGKELTKVYDGLYASAQRNSAPIASLVQLYSRLAINQKALNTSSKGIVDFSDTIAQLLRAGGISAQEASGALLQLSQALGSSRVRAEEFNSILYGAPTILRAAAFGIKEAGGSVAKLRQLMIDGKLSSEGLFKGIGIGAGEITKHLGNTSRTVSQSMTNLYTTMVNAIGKLDEAEGVTNTLGQALNELATTIDSIDTSQMVNNINEVINVLKTMVEWSLKASNAGKNLGQKLGTDAIGKTIDDSGFSDWVNENVPSWFFSINKKDDKASHNHSGEKTDSLNSKVLEDWLNKKYPNGLSDREKEEKTGVTILPKKGGTTTRAKQEPISVNDYLPTAGTTKNSGTKLNDYERQIRATKEQTEALKAEHDALSQLNPAINDHGYALEKAKAKQTLLTAAKRSNIELTPKILEQIEKESEALAKQTVENQKLAEAQEQVKKRLEEAKDIAADFTRTFTDGLINGKNASEAFGDSLMRLGQRLLDSGISQLFNNASQGGGGFGGFFSSILGGLFGGKGFASGTANTGGSRGQPIGVVHGQEAVIPLPSGGRVPVQITGGQQQSNSGSANQTTKSNIMVHVVPSQYFDVTVQEIAGEVAGKITEHGIKSYDRTLDQTIGQKISYAQSRNRQGI